MPCWPAFIGWVKVEEADRVVGGVSVGASFNEENGLRGKNRTVNELTRPSLAHLKISRARV
jgi:hypothetical protein